MQLRLRTLFLLVASCAVPLVAISLLPHPRSFWLGYDSKRQRAFNTIKIGKPKQHAIELLGNPRDTTSYFTREIAYRESDFKPAEIAKCTEFIVWANGGNWFYCIGIDENDTIVLKAEGSS